MSRQRPRVVFLVHRPDYAGGTERATFLLTRALAATGRVDVEVLGLERTSDRPFFAADITVPFHTLVDHREPDPARRPSRLVMADWQSDFSEATDAALTGWLEREQPDVVVATTPGLLAAAVQVAPTNTRIVDIEHRSSSTRGASAEPLRRYGPAADALVSLSASETAWWTDIVGDDGPPLATIANPLPLGTGLRSSLRQPVVLAAGRMVSSKQFDVIVTAFAMARRDGWHLRLVGEGPEVGKVRRTIRETGMCDHVDLIAAIPDLTTEYAKASILVMASKAEGQPLVAMEAQRAGVPVVAFDCPGGTASVVTHGQDGLLVPLDDVDALGEALRRLMDDDALRTAMGTAAWTNRHRFAPDLIAQQWADLLCDVASRPPRRSS
ncbi:MAG: glycosyltransferase [Ilumatobacteraceae bacterium]